MAAQSPYCGGQKRIDGTRAVVNHRANELVPFTPLRPQVDADLEPRAPSPRIGRDDASPLLVSFASDGPVASDGSGCSEMPSVACQDYYFQ